MLLLNFLFLIAFYCHSLVVVLCLYSLILCIKILIKNMHCIQVTIFFLKYIPATPRGKYIILDSFCIFVHTSIYVFSLFYIEVCTYIRRRLGTLIYTPHANIIIKVYTKLYSHQIQQCLQCMYYKARDNTYIYTLPSYNYIDFCTLYRAGQLANSLLGY